MGSALGCSSGWDDFNTTAYDAAEANVITYDYGVGGFADWVGAGAGRDPNYNGTAAEAASWGKSQAENMVSAVEDDGLFSDLSVIFFDMEIAYDWDGYGQYDYNGWANIWSGAACLGQIGVGAPSTALNWDVFDTFRNYVADDTYYQPGVYAGGPYGWTTIVGSGPELANTLEWTYLDEQSIDPLDESSEFPSGWTGVGASAQFFASAPARCQAAWQWLGGNGTSSGYLTDFDQEHSTSFFGTCA